MKHLFYTFLFIIISPCLHAQENEFGLWGGFADYFGDLNTQTSFRYIHPAAGGFYRYNYDSRLSVKTSFSYGRVEGNDATADNYYQRQRNLSFYSDIYEAAVIGEFNFLDYNSTNPKFFFSPYICTGLAVFTFDPKTDYNGSTYRLEPLGTEGQGLPQYPDKKKYKLVSTAWVVGGGIKLRVSKNLSMFIEVTNHLAHTDYLDDVSGTYPSRQVLLNEGGPLLANLSDRSVNKDVGQTNKMRGDAKGNDKYLFVGLGFSVTLFNYKCPYQP